LDTNRTICPHDSRRRAIDAFVTLEAVVDRACFSMIAALKTSSNIV
jgi:hypothetical protein